ENRIWGWAKLVLVWSGLYILAILVLANHLSWYLLPVYPALALAGGAYLAERWNGPTRQSYPRLWSIGLIVMGLSAIAGSLVFASLPSTDRSLSVILASVALTMSVSAVLVARRDLQFILILFWGMYISLLLFMTSPYWSWELEAAYPVKEVAAILNRATLEQHKIYASLPAQRPALKFYSEREVIPASDAELKQRWKQDKPLYLLLDAKTRDRLALAPAKLVGKTDDSSWVLLTQKSN
ncbi:MAG TPA: hypothetical protein V6D26_06005, partial [Stenomitos sp.]